MVRKAVSGQHSSQQLSQQANHDGEDGVTEIEDGEDDVTEIEDGVAQDTNQSISIVVKPRQPRGINKIQDLPAGESVRFNQHGAAVGPHRRKFTTYIGNGVRKNISILIPSWHKVKDEDKDMLWLDIKGKMRLEDDGEVKDFTLKSCGQKWRAFKNTLRNRYMLNNICPRRTYTFLDPGVWKEFCRIEHYTAEKLKRRQEAIARAKSQTNRARVGAKGYAGFEEQWEEERNDPDKATELHKIPGIRASNFCLGRRRYDKDGNVCVPPDIAQIAKRLVETSEKLSQGTIKAPPGADSLTIVCGPDHGGRTRGVSSIVGPKKGLEGYVRKKRAYNKEDLREQLKEELMSGPLFDVLKEKLFEAMRQQPIVGTSTVGSTTRKFRIDSIKETTTCSLFSPQSILTGEKILCAHAAVYPVGDGFIHGKRLQKGHMRVSVFRVLNRQENLDLPVPDEDIAKLGGAVNAFIQWPIGAIACFSPSANASTTVDAAKGNVQGPECSTLNTNVPSTSQARKKRKKMPKAPVELSKVEKEKADMRKKLEMLKDDVDERPEGVKKGYNRWMAREDCTMPELVNFKKEIFRDLDDFTLPLNPTDIIELLSGDQIGINILTLFSRSLYLFLETSPNNKTGFLNPEVITGDTHMDTDIDVGIYLTSALKGYDFFVAPYLHNAHHVLIIICPKHGRGFILDSIKWEQRKTKEDYYLVKQVERVVGKLSWEIPIVNVQEDTVECGFYVMKWMLDFALKYQHDDFPNTIPWGDERSLTLNEMEAAVTAWFSLWRDLE